MRFPTPTIPRFILIGLTLAGLSSCDEGYRLIHEDSREKGANIRLSNFKRFASRRDGSPLWYLKATEAYVFKQDDGGQTIIAYDFNLEEYGPDGKVSGHVVAKRGEINAEKKRIFLEGDVVFREETGRVIESGTLVIDTEEKILTGDDPVTITEDKIKTICQKGIIIYQTEGKQICKNPSGTVYSNSSKDGSAGKNNDDGLEDLFH